MPLLVIYQEDTGQIIHSSRVNVNHTAGNFPPQIQRLLENASDLHLRHIFVDDQINPNSHVVQASSTGVGIVRRSEANLRWLEPLLEFIGDIANEKPRIPSGLRVKYVTPAAANPEYIKLQPGITIFAPLQARWHCAAEFFTALSTLEMPPVPVNLMLYDNSNDDSFAALCRWFMAGQGGYASIAYIKDSTPPTPDRYSTVQAVARIYGRMTHLVDTEYVLTLEDDVVMLDRDCLVRLYETLHRSEGSAAAAGNVIERHDYNTMCWKFEGRTPTIRYVSKREEIQRVDGVSFSCTLWRTRLLKMVAVRPQRDDTSSFYATDITLCADLWEMGYPCLINWGVKCAHVEPFTQLVPLDHDPRYEKQVRKSSTREDACRAIASRLNLPAPAPSASFFSNLFRSPLTKKRLDTLLVLTVRRDTPKQFHTNLSNLTLPEGVVVVVYGFTDPVDWLSHNVQFIDDWNVLSSVILNTSRLVWWDTRVIVKPSDVLTLLRKGTGAVSTDVPLGDVPAGISDVWACDSAQVPKMFNSYGELVGGVFHKESRKISVDSSRWVASTQTWISSGYNVDFAPRVDLPEVVYYGDSVKEAEPRELDLTIAVTAVDHPQMTINAIESMLSTTEGILREIFVWDNASTDPDMHLLYDKYVNHPVVKIFKSQTNRGYIYPMNTMGKRARGKFYVVSNNDIIVHPGWFEALSEPFKDPLVAQTGPVPEYGYLNEAMLGGPGEGPLDYLEGYFFMLPHWVMDRYPVFDEAHLKFATCEDADLSLRLREMGYKILAVPEAKIDHLRSITRVNNAPIRSLMDQTEAQNVKYMLHRWRNYLTTRTFVRHCILVVRGGANGDLLSCEGALKALRWKFPLSRIVLMTKCGAIMENCPWVDDILDSAEPGVEYHLVINLDSAYEVDLGQNRPRQVARLAGVPYVRPGYWTKQSTLDKIRDEFSAHPNLLVVHWRASWANRRWPLSRWKELTQKLSKDFQIVEVGSLADERVDMGIPFFGRSWDEVAALTAISRGVVCSDSVGLHIGVGVKVPTICIFGPTDPKLVADSEFLFPVSVPIDLECLGCHHKPPFPKEYSTCSQPQLYCQIGLTVCRVYDEVMRVMGIDKVCTQ